MRMIFGILGMSLVMVVIFLAQSGQLEALKKIPEVSQVLGGSNQGDKDFSLSAATPQKILESFKKTMNSVAQRNQALLEEEAVPSTPQEAESAPEAAAPSETASSTEATPGASGTESSSQISKYGMSLVKVSAEEASPYLGQWVSATGAAQIRMRLQPDRSISSLRIVVEPHTNISFGHNQLPLWKNAETGLIIFAVGDDEYLQLSGQEAEITGFLYQRERRGDRSRIPEAKAFRRTLQFTLRR